MLTKSRKHIYIILIIFKLLGQFFSGIHKVAHVKKIYIFTYG